MEKNILNGKTYDILKWVAILVLPALSSFIFAIGKIWGIPICEPIAQTVTAFAVFLGGILGISSIQYKKGNENG